MACEQVGGGAVLCKPAGDGGVVWWDAAGNALWIWNWGPIVDWATVLVACVAVFAAWRASTRSHHLQAELNRLERERENRAETELARRIEAEERGAQADLVAAWLAKSDPVMSGGGRPIRKWVVAVNNDSSLPVYGAQVSVVGPAATWHERFSEFISVLPPGRTELTLGEVDLLSMTFQGADGEPEEVLETVEDLTVRISFRDTAGRLWHRDEHGELSSRGRRVKLKVGDLGTLEGVLRAPAE